MATKFSEKQIQKLIETSREIIRDAALENGAIVATNTDKAYYPREAANYRWVWPRDASFICVAAELLEIPIQEPFFDWLYRRPKDFKKDKLLFANYSTNGQFGSMGRLFQADQAGEILWAIYEHFKKDLKKSLKYQDLIERLANGLVTNWNKNYFLPHTVDLWEEPHRQTTTTVENNFTYSLAACARGLILADEMIPNQIWKEVAMRMIKKLNEAYNAGDKYFYRNKGKISDKNVDASLLGLAWPFEICKADDERMSNTVARMEERIVIDGGVHRYEYDYFDGEGSAQEGGGAWPLLNFWMAIYWAKRGDMKKALSYYNWVLERIDKFGGYIPEQIFDDFRIGVYPLVWAHAMFIIASRALGYLK
jgi:GH15 family glucan-1,4-alpha-glucosidase